MRQILNPQLSRKLKTLLSREVALKDVLYDADSANVSLFAVHWIFAVL